MPAMNRTHPTAAQAEETSSRSRRFRLTWLAVSMLLLIPQRPAEAQSMSPPLTYGAISDRTIRPYQSLPAVGTGAPPWLLGAGSQFIDPVFGSTLLRVTDAKTRPDVTGSSWYTPSSAETNAWNTNSTMFYVAGSGGEQIPFSFDPVTMTASRIGDTTNPRGGLVLGFNSEPAFSFLDSDLIYGVINDTQLSSYRFSTATFTLLHDETTCLPPGVSTDNKGGGTYLSHDDQRILDIVGGVQDSNMYVYVWDRTLGCRWLDTQNGTASGWGGRTPVPYSGDSNFFIHHATISGNGRWVRITVAGCSPSPGGPPCLYFWDVNSSNPSLIPCNVSSPTFCGGHMVLGYNNVINQRALPINLGGDGLDFAIRPLSTPTSATALINPLLTPQQYYDDTHPSWNNVRSDEHTPVCMEAFRADDYVQRAWDGEIICIETDGVASNVWRFAHHRSCQNRNAIDGCPDLTQTTATNFWDQPRANVSQDGRFLLFTSNWEDNLGTLDIPGSGGIRPFRDDVFVVQLAAPPAQTLSFTAQPEVSARTNAASVAVGDFNSDFKVDLAVANYDAQTVSVMLGTGNGTFEAAVDYAAGALPVSVAVGDFNGDGKLDIAAANAQSGDVSVLLGNGDGTFQAALTFAVGGGPASVAVGDFNGDGKLDLAVANAGDRTISVLVGNGDGTFQAALNFAVGGGPGSVAVGDFNGDGKLDIAAANAQSDDVSVLLGNGDGTFQAALNFAVGSGPGSVAVGDFNGDGKLDVAVVNHDSGTVSVLLNTSQ